MTMNLSRTRKELAAIFNSSQRLKSMKSSAKEFMKHYCIWRATDDFDIFMTSFVNLIKSVLASNRNSYYTKRSLEFLSITFKYIQSFEEDLECERLNEVARRIITGDLNTSTASSDEDMDELGAEAFDLDETIIDKNFLPQPTTMDHIIKTYLMKFLSSENVNVRTNTASLLRKIVETFDEMDEITFSEIEKGLSQSTFDRDYIVRSISILSLYRLQDAWDPDDDALRTIIFHLSYDPNVSVRTCALKTLEISSVTLDKILKATKDINRIIRRTAILKIAQYCEILHFKIEDRYFLLSNGIRDSDPDVRNAILKNLIPSWINRLDNDIEKFLELLDIRQDIPFFHQMLHSYFGILNNKGKNISAFHNFVFDFKSKYLDSYKLFTKVNLTDENIFLWQELCNFCIKNNVDYKKVIEKDNVDNENDALEENQTINIIDDILPDIPFFCEYIDGFISKVLEKDHSGDNESKNFIFIQLLKIAQLFEVKDTATWQKVLATFKGFILNDELYSTFDNFLEEIIIVFSNYFKNDNDAFLNCIFDLINLLNHPDLNVDSQQLTTGIEMCSEVSASCTQNERMNSDPVVLERCINLCYCYLHVGYPKKPNSLLSTLINRIVVPNLAFKDSEKVRLLSVKALGNYCFSSSDTINHFLRVFEEIIQEKNYYTARVEALKFLFDFVGYHGFKKIRYNTNDFTDIDSSSQNFFLKNSTLDKTVAKGNFFDEFIGTVCNFLTQPSFEVKDIEQDFKLQVEYDLFETSVKGTCKIFTLIRIYSQELLAYLIVIYCSYKNITNSLRHFIRGFFGVYFSKPDVLKTHFNTEKIYVEAYYHCFKLLIEDFNYETENMNVYESINNVFLYFIRDCDLKNYLFIDAINVFELSVDKNFVSVILKFLTKMVVYSKLTLSQLEELHSKWNFTLKRYIRNNRTSKRNDRNVELFQKIISSLEAHIEILNTNESVAQETFNDEDVEMTEVDDD